LRAEAMEAAARRREERVKAGFDPDASIVEAVRHRLDLAAELVCHDYKHTGGNRYLYPGSQTGVPGVYVMAGRDGVERVYSHHSGDPLAEANLPSWCRAKAVDVVDVVTILDYGSDLKVALRTLARKFGIGASRTKQEQKPPPLPDDDDDPGYQASQSAEAERDAAALAKKLSASTWLDRELPPIDRLLGDFITTTTRAFLVGRTGLGKTMFGLACAIGMAFGIGFLHWRSERPARVLYIDGEMPAELLIQRVKDAARRIGREDLIGNLMVFSTEDAEDIAALFPMLGMFEPLNTDAGQEFIKRLVGMLKPDAIILDNVQSLLAGVQKEEETWIPVLPLVGWLTKQRVGQLWLDHTGHAADRQYGTATKSWRMDALGHMAPLPDDHLQPYEMAFTLSFDPPAGKARRRTPDSWQEFAPHIIRLRQDVWTSEPIEKTNGAGNKLGNVPPSRVPFYDALIVAIARDVGDTSGTSLAAWEAQCQRRGLIDPPPDKESYKEKDARLRDFRRAKSVLLGARWIAIEGDEVLDLKGLRRP
jgi:hypothetical protein